jgi:hypothetical protein
MPKPTSAVLPRELLTFLRNPLVSTRTLQILYLRSSKLISKRSQKFLITAIPAVRRQLRWAMLFALLRAYISFMRRVILDPRSGFERSINRNGGWLLLVALRERVRARLRRRAEKKVEGTTTGEGFVTPPTSPATSVSSGLSYSKFSINSLTCCTALMLGAVSAAQQIPDYFLRSPDADPVLRAVRQVMPDATGYKVIVPQPSPSENGQENASHELAKRISGKKVETKAFFQDGMIRTPPLSESGKQKIVALVLMEDVGDRKSIKGAVTVDTGSGIRGVEAKEMKELGVSFAEALDF